MKKNLLLFLLFPLPLSAATHTVREGESIQKAIDRAKAGDTIEVMPAIYRENLVIDKPNIELRGRRHHGRWPTLEGDNKKNDAIIASGSGFLLENFHIRNFKGNGVTTQGADYVTLRKLFVENTGIYGIYPTRGKHVTVEDTITTGIADAAIYIGMCENVDVRRNEAFRNVAGIEVENSHRVLVEENYVHDNSGGILAFTLPGLPVKTGSDIIIRKNTVTENNLKNFAPEGAIVASVPTGSGIIILASDEVRIEDNIIRGNETGGIIFGDLSYLSDVTSADPQVEPNTDQGEILENVFVDNGSKPHGDVKLLLLFKHFRFTGGDVLSSGTGKGNCLHPALGARTAGTDKFKQCPRTASTRSVRSFVEEKPASLSSHTLSASEVGQRVYTTVCSGCHALGMRRIGPPIEEIQAKYKGNPNGIAQFAMSPKKVRPGYPPMPPQDYLGEAKLKEVARYLLQMK